jgi:hypothetical protein
MKEINNGRRIEKRRKPQWQIAIERAREEAMSLLEAEASDIAGAHAMARFLARQIDGVEYRAIANELEADTRGQVLFEDHTSLQYVLERILGDLVLAAELVEHEQDHYQEAMLAGMARVHYLIRFFRDSENNMSLRAAVSFNLPDDMDDETARAALRTIVEAPEKLSDVDAMCLLELPETDE